MVLAGVVVDVVFLVVVPVFPFPFPLEFPLEFPFPLTGGSVLKVANHHWMKLAMVEKYCIQFDALILFLSLLLGLSLEPRAVSMGVEIGQYKDTYQGSFLKRRLQVEKERVTVNVCFVSQQQR